MLLPAAGASPVATASRDAAPASSLPAEPIEAELIARLKEVVTDLDDLRVRARGLAQQRVLAATAEADQRDALVAERDSINKKIDFVIDNFCVATEEASKQKAAQLNERLTHIERRITAIDSKESASEIDVDEIADSVVEQVRQLRTGLVSGCNASIRRLVQLLVSRLVVDLDTKQVEMELRLPDWAADEAFAS